MDNLSIVIPFFNGHATINRLLEDLPKEIPVIVIDDQSDIPYKALSSDIQVIRPSKKLYFTGAVNLGIKACQTDVLILNQDVWFDSHDAFALLAEKRQRYAMIGERINGTHPAFGDLGYIHGTFMFLRRDAIGATGFLNDADYPLWGSTAEYQWRIARRGYPVLPLVKVPGFRHQRPDTKRFGTSIQTLLEREPDKRDWLVRTPPLLSVIVPCYNYGRYLPDCINSLIGGDTCLGYMPGQSLQSFEIIIVDDASTDNSLEYIERVTDIGKGIRSYHLEKNVGTARALNAGIHEAVGKYITFLSADDMREPDSLERLVKLCEENPHSFAYDDVWLFNRHKRIKQWRLEEYDFETLIWKNHVHAGIVFPKKAWEDVGGYPAIMGDGREDWAFNVALGIKGWCGIHDKHFGYLYRREGQNRTERNTTEEHRQRFLRKIMDLFPNIYMGERPMACCGRGGSRNRTNNGTVSTLSLMGGSAMAGSMGKEGMTKIEYTGNQVMFTITGEVTNAPYTFGRDRPRGWVDSRDVGSREERKGFLGVRDRTTQAYLFKLVETKETAQKVEEPVKMVVAVAEEEQPVQQETGTAEAKATLTADSSLDVPDPTDMSVEEIKRLELTKDQWTEVYKIELANRNRKSAISYVEEVLANWQD